MSCINRNDPEYKRLRKLVPKMSDAAFDAKVGAALADTGKYPNFEIDDLPQAASVPQAVENKPYEEAVEESIRKIVRHINHLKAVGTQTSEDFLETAKQKVIREKRIAKYEILLEKFREREADLAKETFTTGAEAAQKLEDDLGIVTEYLKALKDLPDTEENTEYLTTHAVDELNLIKDILQGYNAITSVSDDLKNKIYEDKDQLDDSKFKEVRATIKDALDEHKVVTNKIIETLVAGEILRRKKSKVRQIVKKGSTEEDAMREQAKVEAAEMFKDGEYINSDDNLWNMVFALDMNDANDPVASIIKTLVDNTFKKDESVKIRAELGTLKANTLKTLKQLGLTQDAFKAVDAKGSPRLISVESDNYIQAKEYIQNREDEIDALERQTQTAESRINIKDAKMRRAKKLDENFLSVNSSMLPEVTSLFPDDFESVDAAANEEYKAQLKRELSGHSSNSEVGEMLYKEMVDRQITKLYAWKEKYNQMYNTPGLTAAQRNEITRRKAMESPFNVHKYMEAGDPTALQLFSPRYTELYPKGDQNFDSNFTQIDTNADLFRAWKSLRDGVKFINENKKVYGSKDLKDNELALPHTPELVAPEPGIKNRIKMFLDNMLDHLIVNITRQPLPPGEVVRQKVFSAHEAAKNNIKAQRGIYRKIRLELKADHINDKVNMLSPQVQTILRDYLGHEKVDAIKIPNDGAVRLSEILYEHAVEAAAKEVENVDLFDSIHNASVIVKTTKAQKEIEGRVKMLREFLKGTNAEDGNPDRNLHNTNKAVDYFINKKFYQQESEKKPINLKRFRTSAQRKTIDMIESEIKELKGLLNTGLNDKKIHAEIGGLQKSIENIGRMATLTSVAEGALLKLNILASLGYNVKSQFMNKVHGDSSASEGDGRYWTEGNLATARKYYGNIDDILRKRGIYGQKQKNNVSITNALLDMQGIFQNSANELEESKSSRVDEAVSEFGKTARLFKPMEIIQRTERVIQTPQILSMLGDEYITDKNGNEVPAFNARMGTKEDAYNGEAHPAFELDENKILKLKPEFDTEENRNTWINQNSDRHAELFADSGYIPTMIRVLNGDYGHNTTVMGKKTTIGRFFFMFKTWAPNYLKFKKDAFDDLRAAKSAGAGTSVLTARNLIAAIGVSSLVGAVIPMSAPLAIGLPWLTLKLYSATRSMSAEKRIADIRAQRKSLSDTAFLMKMARARLESIVKTLPSSRADVRGELSGLLGVGAKTLQSSVLFNNRVVRLNRLLKISNENVASIGGVKLDKVDGQELKDAISAYNALAVKGRDALVALILKVAIQTMIESSDDDEEEREYKKFIESQNEGDGVVDFSDIVERFLKYPGRASFNLATNLTDRVMKDATLDTNIVELLALVFTNSPIGGNTFGGQVTGVEAMLDTKEKQSGRNKGQNGFSIFLEGLLPNVDLGFETSTGDVFNKESTLTKIARRSEAEAYQERRENVKDIFTVAFDNYKEDKVAAIRAKNKYTEAQIEGLIKEYDDARTTLIREFLPTGLQKGKEPTESSFWKPDGTPDTSDYATRRRKHMDKIMKMIEAIESKPREEQDALIKQFISEL